MLFDLQSGKRRTVVRIVYGTLAALFLIGFVGFSIGSNVSGGIFDALGLTNSNGGGSSDSSATQYDTQIEQAEKQLKKNPQDPTALSNLAYYRYLAGAAQADVDETTQQITPTDATREEWNQALNAWEKYLKTDPKKPEVRIAGPMVAAYQALGDLSGAAKTQALVVKESPSAIGYGQLAYFLYADGKIPAGDAAADKAVAEAKGKQAKQLKTQLAKIAKQAKLLEQQASSQSAGGQGQLQNPFGGLGASPGITTPAP